MNFTCIAKDTSTLSWISKDYIDIVRLDVSSDYQDGTHNSSESSIVAVHVNTSSVNETSLLTSTLIVTVSPSIMDHNHTVVCQNVDIGTASSIFIEMNGTCLVILY